MIDERRRGARRVERLEADSGRFLAVIQLGLTFVGSPAAAFAGASLVDDLADFRRATPLIAKQAQVIALLIVTALVSLFTVVFGQLVPKAIALAYADRLAVVFAGPVEILG